MIHRQQQIAALRKQLKAREDELAAFRDASGGAAQETERWKKKAAGLEDRVQQQEQQVQSLAQQLSARRMRDEGATRSQSAPDNANNSNDSNAREMRGRLAEQAATVEGLRQELALAKRAGAGGGGRGGGGDERLRDENEKLKRELAAFDLDFFEVRAARIYSVCVCVCEYVCVRVCACMCVCM
jgi:chromosome segregation ATPase